MMMHVHTGRMDDMVQGQAETGVGGVAGPMLVLLTNRTRPGEVAFHDAGDFRQFAQSLEEVGGALELQPTAWLLLPDTFHLLLAVDCPVTLSSLMQRLLTTHVRRYRARHGGYGQVWAGRTRRIAVQPGPPAVTVAGFLARLSVRRGLVQRPQDWRWGARSAGIDLLPAHPAVDRHIATAIETCRPIGDAAWEAAHRSPGGCGAAKRRGRPAKAGAAEQSRQAKDRGKSDT